TRYCAGADGWLTGVCLRDFDEIAVNDKRYELLRLWLLGSHAAHLRLKPFVLVNLVREVQQDGVEGFAATRFHQSDDRSFRRATWESIMRLLGHGNDRNVAQL